MRPLYTALDERPEEPLPGQWPFVRSGDAHRDVLAGWKVAEEFPAPDCHAAAQTNAAILGALVDGVSALVLRVGDSGVAPDELDRVLAGVHLDLAPVLLVAGEQFTPAAQVLIEVAGGDGLAIDLGADPLTAELDGRAAPAMGDVMAVAAVAAGRGGIRTITVDGSAFHGRGANAGWELAGVVAAGADYLRLLTNAGLDVAGALSQISFRLVADDDQFMTIAKFRAARRLWARVADVLGHPACGVTRLHAVTSAAMMAQRDPWVNMLRTTVAAFGAGAGGADTVEVRGFDSAIPGGYPGVKAGFARRIARNAQLLLLEESHIGRVLDPAGGSWFVEDLTRARRAGLDTLPADRGAGWFQPGPRLHRAQIAEVAAQRRRRHRPPAHGAHRRQRIPRTSAETPLPHRRFGARTDSVSGALRYAAGFEALRDRSDVRHLAQRRPAEGAAAAAGTARRAQHPHDLRREPARVGRDRGRQSRHRGCGQRIAEAVGGTGAAPVAVICGTDARYGDRGRGVSRRPARRDA